jgi:ArsR family transcriptional regulator
VKTSKTQHNPTIAKVLRNNEVEKISKIFQILADPARLKIVLALMNGDMCVGELTGVCDVTQSAVSHQLRVLRDNRIVKGKRLGQKVEYSIADGHIREIIEMGIAHLTCVDGE